MRQEFRDVRWDALLEQQEGLTARIEMLTANGGSAASIERAVAELDEVEQAIRHHSFKGH